MTALKVDNQIFEPSSFQITCSSFQIVFLNFENSQIFVVCNKNRSDNDGQVFLDDVNDGVLETVYKLC